MVSYARDSVAMPARRLGHLMTQISPGVRKIRFPLRRSRPIGDGVTSPRQGRLVRARRSMFPRPSKIIVFPFPNPLSWTRGSPSGREAQAPSSCSPLQGPATQDPNAQAATARNTLHRAARERSGNPGAGLRTSGIGNNTHRSRTRCLRRGQQGLRNAMAGEGVMRTKPFLEKFDPAVRSVGPLLRGLGDDIKVSRP